MTYRLTVEAEADLIDIWQYTARTWGLAQADTYLADFEACFGGLQGVPGRRWPEIDKRLRSVRCREHVVFWLETGAPLVVAVLHGRMDLMVRLRGRL